MGDPEHERKVDESKQEEVIDLTEPVPEEEQCNGFNEPCKRGAVRKFGKSNNKYCVRCLNQLHAHYR